MRGANLQVYEKNCLTYPPSCILTSFLKNASRSLLPKRLWKRASKTSFSKYKQKLVLLVIYPFNDHFWRFLEYGFCQINWNLLKYKDYKNILLFSACVFWYVLFDKLFFSIMVRIWLTSTSSSHFHTFSNNGDVWTTL